ncbi:hypothetical protein N0Y54_32755, partial [Nostoc punctiforme UO1]|uniref:hypothetical protein n=1 Tax=Nostoc punctiforme TaxID=272131 RepID=UPI0030AB0708
MSSNFYISDEEIEKIFCTELVKYGVKYEKAVIAAKILASGQPDDFLSSEERKIVKQACEKWFLQNSRYKKLKALV